jgi:hypothetical protein
MGKFLELPSEPHPSFGGSMRRVHYPNGYGASIVRHKGSYGGKAGLYELGVLHNNKLCYTTPITDDVLGHLKESEVDGILTQIQELPPIVE